MPPNSSPLKTAQWPPVGSAKCGSQQTAQFSAVVETVRSTIGAAFWSPDQFPVVSTQRTAHTQAFSKTQWSSLGATLVASQLQTVDSAVEPSLKVPFVTADNHAQRAAHNTPVKAAIVASLVET